MVEIHSESLRSGLSVLSGILMPDASAVLLAVNGVWRVNNGKMPEHRCREMHLQPRYVARSGRSNGAVVVDSSGLIVRVPISGRCIVAEKVALSAAHPLLGRLGSRWAQLLIARRQAPYLLLLTSHERIVRRITTDQSIRFGDASQYSVRSDGTRLLLTEVSYPFRVFHLAESGKLELAFEPVTHLSIEERALARRWSSLPPVRLDDAYLQEIADRTSDIRHFFVFDERGELLRESSVDVPMGVLDVDGTTKRLLVLRNTGVPELVVYKWRWRTNSSE
jgi:hypothetical protein